MRKMTAKEKKEMAQDLIMNQISIIGYGTDFEEFVNDIGDLEEAQAILKKQMDRVANIFGFNKSWFS